MARYRLDTLDELALVNICSFLPQRDVVSLRAVCSRFRDVIDRQVGLFVVLQTGYSREKVKRIMELRIKELVLTGWSDSLSSIISTLSPLSDFPLKYPDVVRTLTITSNHRIPKHTYNSIMSTLTMIEELNLHGTTLISRILGDDDVYHYGRQYPAYGNVKKLGLRHDLLFKDHNFSIRENMIRVLSCNFPKLEYLRIDYNRLKSNDGIFPLYQKALEFVGRHNSTMKELVIVVEERTAPGNGHNSAAAAAAAALQRNHVEVVDKQLVRSECIRALKRVQLKRIALILDRYPDIELWADLLKTQKRLTNIDFGFEINNQHKINSVVETVTRLNADTLKEVCLTKLPFISYTNSEAVPFDLTVFAGVSNLKVLQLQRNPKCQGAARLLNLNKLPKRIECILLRNCGFMTHDFQDMLEGMTNLKQVFVKNRHADGGCGLTYKNVNTIFKNNRNTICFLKSNILNTDVEDDIALYREIAMEFDIEEREELEGEYRITQICYQRDGYELLWFK